MSKVNKWNQRTVPTNTKKVDTRAVSKKPDEKIQVERAVCPVSTMPRPIYTADMSMLSTVPYASARLQGISSPFCVDRVQLAKFNNFRVGCESTCDATTPFQSEYPNGHFLIGIGPAHNSSMGRRLNSPNFNAESGGYALSSNGIVGSTIWLCVGDQITLTYKPGECRHRRRIMDNTDYICITTDPFGGNAFSTVNQYSPDPSNPNITPSLAPEPVFGTQKIFRDSTETVFVAPWMAYQNLYIVESAAVGTFLRVVVLLSCD